MVRWSHLQVPVVLLAVMAVFIAPLGFVGTTNGLTSGVLQAEGDPDQSTPEPHQDPTGATESEIEQRRGVQEHLEETLADRLEEATEDATEADYQEARQPLGSEYDEQLTRYTEVTEESQAELYIEAREQQYQFIESNERFDEIQNAHTNARQNGNDRRARDLQGQLREEATSISESGNALISSYHTLEDRTGENRIEEIRLIKARQAEVEQYVTQTEEAGLVNTTLLISTDRTNISFDEPTRISGQLETATGSPIANQNVSIVVEDQLYRVQTDSAGQFGLVHRPVDSLGATTLDIEYQPNSTSEYQATRREIPVNVSQVSSAVRIDSPTSEASFDSNLTMTGSVVAGSQNRPAPEAPVALFVDNQRLQTVDTNETGRFSFSTAIPRSITGGNTVVGVRTVGSNQSITPSSNTTQVRIEPVTTSISLQTDTDETNPQSVAVTGSLKTDSGKPIPNSTIDLTVNDDTVDTVTTTQNGTFERSLTLSEDAENSTAAIGATFTGSGTHLRSTTKTVDLQPSNDNPDGIQPQPSQRGTELSLLPLPARDLLFVSGGMITLFGLLGFWWVRRGGTVNTESSSVADPVAVESTPKGSHNLFSVAEQQLESDAYENAIVLAYVAVRRRLGQLWGLPDGLTHRELYQSYTATERDHRADVELITQQYERVRFASEDVDESTANRAVSAAEQILDEVDHSENETR